MKAIRLIFPLVAMLAFSFTVMAEEKVDAPKSDAPKTEAPKADAPKTDAKPAETGELPKAPEGTPGLANAHQSETLVGDIKKGAAPAKSKKQMTKAEKKAAKGGVPDQNVLTLQIAGAKIKGDKASKKGRTVVLTATGDVLTQLTSLAEKNAHISVTGDVVGDTMTVSKVSDTPAEEAKPAKKKKKKDNNA